MSEHCDHLGCRNAEACIDFSFIYTEKKEAKHLDTGKVALQYVLVFKGLDEVAKVGEFGAKKYGQFNYKAGASYMRFLGSCTRHLASFIRGEDKDIESGFSHLAHLIFDALMLLDWIDRKVGQDDRYKDNA